MVFQALTLAAGHLYLSGVSGLACPSEGQLIALQRVEANPLHVKETSAESMLACWRYFKELESMK